MDLLAAFKIALKALTANKMRSFLTMLGIIIGVGSVIGMIGIGQGAQKQSMDQIQNMGSNVVTVFSEDPHGRGIVRSGSDLETLTVEDSDAIEVECKTVVYSSPMLRKSLPVIYKNNNTRTGVTGYNTNLPFIRNWNIDTGRFYTDNEVKSAAKVAVIGKQVQEDIFGSIDPVDKVIRISGIPFRVIGIMESKGAVGWGRNMDDQVIIPFTTHMRNLERKTKLDRIVASARTQEETERAVEEIKMLLRQRHRIKNEADDFDIRTQAEWMENANQSNQQFTIFLAAVASVSLLVGGIGIMNIMLVSVTERIREIGIRMAIGAKKNDILTQFIIEAIVLSLLGGLIGIGLGYGIATAFAKIAKWPVLISSQSVVMALGFSSAIGVFFGFYPAWKASKLDPIDALRQQ